MYESKSRTLVLISMQSGPVRLRDSISHILTGVWTSGGHHITHCLIHHCWRLINNTVCVEGRNVYSEMETLRVKLFTLCVTHTVNV